MSRKLGITNLTLGARDEPPRKQQGVKVSNGTKSLATSKRYQTYAMVRIPSKPELIKTPRAPITGVLQARSGQKNLQLVQNTVGPHLFRIRVCMQVFAMDVFAVRS